MGSLTVLLFSSFTENSSLTASLYTNHKQAEKETMETLPFTIASKKNLRISLNRGVVKEVNNEKSKSLN